MENHRLEFSPFGFAHVAGNSKRWSGGQISKAVSVRMHKPPSPMFFVHIEMVYDTYKEINNTQKPYSRKTFTARV
jgi:hypothetical protein